MLEYFKHVIELRSMFIDEIMATIFMAGCTGLIAFFFGIILGVALTLTDPSSSLWSHQKQKSRLYSVLDKLVNIGRSIPFVILLAILAPLTRLIVGTTIGNTAAIVPLVMATIPFYARQVQNVFAEIDSGVIEAAQSMGFSTRDIVVHVLLAESKEGLIRSGALTMISIIGYTAMAGAIGAGGLGKLAIYYGFNRFNSDVTLVATLLILLLVFLVQACSDLLIKLICKH